MLGRTIATSLIGAFAFMEFMVLAPTVASAATASFSHSILSTQLYGGATIGAGGLQLPDSGQPGFLFTIILPQNYDDNATVKIVMYFEGNPSAESCTALFVPVDIFRQRPGSVPSTGNTSGISPANGEQTTAFLNSAIVKKTWDLKKSSSFPGQRKGDALTLYFSRIALNEQDSCPRTLRLIAIDVRYPVE